MGRKKKTYPIGTKVEIALVKFYEKKNGCFCPGILVSLNESEIEGKCILSGNWRT